MADGDRSEAARRGWETRRGGAPAERKRAEGRRAVAGLDLEKGSGPRRVSDDDARIMAVAQKVWEGKGDHNSLHAWEWSRAEKLMMTGSGLTKATPHEAAAPTMAHAVAARVMAERAAGKEPASGIREKGSAGAAPGDIGHRASAEFGKAVAGKEMTGKRTLGAGNADEESANVVHTGKMGEHDVFAKPSREKLEGTKAVMDAWAKGKGPAPHPGFDAKEAVSLHQAMHKHAEELGMGHLLQPAALHRDAKGQESFVTRSAGKDVKPVYKVPPAQVAKQVPNEERLAGALLDHLHANTDRHGKNALLDGKGRMTLIDHDLTHGRTTGDKPRSVFFPGGHASYTGKQGKVGDLPKKMADHVRDLASSTGREVGERYGLTDKEGEGMRDRARDIEKHGLDSAIKKSGGWGWNWNEAVKRAKADARGASKKAA